ncbi:ABC transporter substrate-binding protein [cf. Phormidesmis sp. LEGE 11477]|uniref:ABC transporter substrate-binding protein n=1 Tax=cf. Phormidesmis sp. LEGE 11477 TaxID=1828680 RepID=UPI00187F7B9A|nr:aliphatic sulfonate ABC transporter substrate-binding protein [cf. Phormidesmis sp. LEGE 11477]MBE9061389.1 aliphatic sulfonate ABC transporter substrate-binding protein [cf. Phormidesmis sp. LEGE 11477]
MAAGVLAACAKSAPDSASNPSANEQASASENTQLPTAVNFGSFSVAVDYAPYLIAKNKGWFEEALGKEGIETNYVTFQSLPPINEAFATDRVDVVFEAEPPAIIAKSAGIGVKIADISCVLVQEILVPTTSLARSAADLKGKKIAVLAGTSSHYGLINILETAGLSAGDVEIIDLVPPDAQGAFDSGQVDAWAVWPPFVEQAELSGTGRVLPRGDAYINSVVVVREKFAEQYPQVFTQILEVVQTAKTWIQSNSEEAKQIVSEELDVPLEAVEKAWERHQWDAQITEDIIEDIQLKSDFFSQNGFIQNSVNAKELVDTAFSP